jgi:hypothetical protein
LKREECVGSSPLLHLVPKKNDALHTNCTVFQAYKCCFFMLSLLNKASPHSRGLNMWAISMGQVLGFPTCIIYIKLNKEKVNTTGACHFLCEIILLAISYLV